MTNILGFKFQFSGTRSASQDVDKLDESVENLNESLEETKDKTKDAEKAQKQAKEEYKESRAVLGDYVGELRIGGVQLKTFTGVLKTQGTALKASNKFLKFNVKSLKLFKLALAGTGIGLLVVALGSLVAYLSSTQKGMDAVNKVLKQGASIINNLIERAAKFGEGLVKIFTGKPGEGIRDIRDTFKGLGQELRDDISAAGEVAKEAAAIRDAQIALDVKTAEVRKRIKELEFEGEEKLKLSAEERKKINAEALELEKGLTEERIKLQERVIANIEKENGLSITTAEDEEALAEAKIKLAELETESIERQLTLRNKVNENTVESLALAEKIKAETKTHVELLEEQIQNVQKLIDSGTLEGSDLKAKILEILNLEGQLESFNNELAKTVSLATQEITDTIGLTDGGAEEVDTLDLIPGTLDESTNRDKAIEQERGDLAMIREMRAQNWAEMRQDALDAQQAMREDEEFFESQRAGIILDSTDQISGAIEGFFNGQIKTFKEFNKALLGVLLDAIGKSVELILVEAAAKSFAQNPILGAFVFAGIRGIVKGMLGAAKNQIQSFGEGGVSDLGIIQGPSHSAGGVDINVEGGEGIINKRSMASQDRLTVTGTPRQIASSINSYKNYGRSFDAHRSYSERFALGGISGSSVTPQFVTPSRLLTFSGSGGGSTPNIIADESIQKMTASMYSAVRSAIAVGHGENNRRREAEQIYFDNSQK